MKRHTVTETCPECGTLVTAHHWDKNLHGMRITCPECKTSMLLCGSCKEPCDWDSELDTCKEDNPGRQTMTLEILKKRLFLPIYDVSVKKEPTDYLLLTGKSRGTNIVLTLPNGDDISLFDYLWFCYTGKTEIPKLRQAVNALFVPLKRIRFSDFHTLILYLWDQGYTHLPMEWYPDGQVCIEGCLPIAPHSMRVALKMVLEEMQMPFKSDILRWLLPVFDPITGNVSPQGKRILTNTIQTIKSLKAETPPDRNLKELVLLTLSEHNTCTLPDRQPFWGLINDMNHLFDRVEIQQNTIRLVPRPNQRKKINRMLRKLQLEDADTEK